jgi:membrane-associated phospholipid phosphatase
VLVWPVLADDRSALERQVDRIPHTELDLRWLRGDANIWSGAVSAVLAGIAFDRASIDSPYGGLSFDADIGGPVEKFGDDLQSLATVAGYITSLTAKDYRGFVYMGVHNVVSSGVTQMLKSGVKQSRPGDQDNKSFPSGHTNTAFLGAAFMQQRYGSAWGLPSYVSALIVGWSRVYANQCIDRDVECLGNSAALRCGTRRKVA